MFPPFKQDLAQYYNELVISLIEKGELALMQISRESEERKNQGIMLGSLVCYDKNTNEQIILLAVSGIAKQLVYSANKSSSFFYNQEHFIIVEPLVSPEKIEKALSANDKEIHELTAKINEIKNTVESESDENNIKLQELAERRNLLCTKSLQNVFDLYSFSIFNGKKITLQEIIKKHWNKLPPTGTGDCCAPKLLSFAFDHNLQPVSMDEKYYGNSSRTKENGKSYAPCHERCGYILPEILGLEILYRDEHIVVINKSSGLLSIPGRTEDKQDCVTSRLKNLFPNCIEQPSVHRLDMETSGLLVLALTKEAHRDLSIQFQEGNVKKEYIAILDGVLQKAKGDNAPKNGEKKGHVELKFRVDLENRPHQIYDEEYGKLGITDWELLDVFSMKTSMEGEKHPVTKVLFKPVTGRTHQLRLVSADSHGFGLPIVGDTLYGICRPGERLLLHSCKLEFNHPQTKERMCFYCPENFE